MKSVTNRLMPFSTVSRTNVDASWTQVLLLAEEKPEMAEDSEIEERREWSVMDEPIPMRGPSFA